MKKIIKSLVLIILSIVITVGIVLGGIGYSGYKSALKETPIKEKVSEIQENVNYTKIEEMPKIYKNAVISV